MINLKIYIPAAFVFTLGLTVSLVLYSNEKKSELRIEVEHFKQSALGRIIAIENRAKVKLTVLSSLVGLFHGSSHINREEFQSFIEEVTASGQNLQALEWIPHVTASKRKVYEQAAREAGYSQFQVKEKNAKGETIPARAREAYYPVYYVEPYQGNEAALGFDLGSNKVRLTALKQARDTGKMVTSSAIKLVQLKENNAGVLIFAPVYKKNTTHVNVEQRRQHIEGFALAVIRISSLVSGIVNSSELANVEKSAGSDIYLFDESEKPNKQLLYKHLSRTRSDNPAPVLSLNESLKGVYVKHSFMMGDRKWSVVAIPVDPTFSNLVAESSRSILSISLFMTLLITMYFILLMRRNKLIDNQVKLRTADLEGSEEHIRTIIETAVDAVITIDSKGKIDTFNRAAETNFGYSAAEVIGHNINILMPEPYHHEHDGYLAHYQQTGEARIIGIGREVIGQRKDGSTFPMHLSISEFTHAGKRMFTGIVRDISERIKVEQELIKAKEEAEHANRSKSEFLANMSHEIRTPMNGVLGMLELLDDSSLNTKQNSYVDTARESAVSLLTIINDILDFSKIEAGHLILEHTPFNLRKTVEDAAIMLAKMAAVKNIEVNCLVLSDVTSGVVGDPVRLRQVLINLISNAIKFTQQGEVDVCVSLQEETDVYSKLLFEVKDTGIGISKEKQESLFGAFIQEDGSTTRKFGGTGLGLSISKQLTQLMGGEIGVNSTQGKGSTFWFSAKFEKTSEQFEQSAKSLPDNLRILTVDDNNTNQKILSHYFSNWKLPHASTDNGEIALQQLRDASAKGEAYQVVILDYHMPEMDGIELAQKIIEDASLGKPRLILLSSVGDSDEMVRQSGIERHLVKPVRQSDLYDALLQDSETVRQKPQQKTQNNNAPSQFKNARVLLVDDMATNQIVGMEILSRLGVEVAVAENGQQAVDFITNHQYDMVFMDCQMPVMDGYAATEVIRAKEKAKNSARLPIVALTAHAMQGDKEICLAAGMDDYLSKPFTREDIKNMLVRWLPEVEDTLSTQSIQLNQSSEENNEASSHSIAAIETNKATTDDSLFDEHKLDELRQLTGNNLHIILDAFENDAVTVMPRLTEAALNENEEELRQSAHALKGVSAGVAAMRLSNLCSALEKQARNNQIENLSQQVKAIKEVYENTLEAIKQM